MAAKNVMNVTWADKEGRIRQTLVTPGDCASAEEYVKRTYVEFAEIIGSYVSKPAYEAPDGSMTLHGEPTEHTQKIINYLKRGPNEDPSS